MAVELPPQTFVLPTACYIGEREPSLSVCYQNLTNVLLGLLGLHGQTPLDQEGWGGCLGLCHVLTRPHDGFARVTRERGSLRTDFGSAKVPSLHYRIGQALPAVMLSSGITRSK